MEEKSKAADAKAEKAEAEQSAKKAAAPPAKKPAPKPPGPPAPKPAPQKTEADMENEAVNKANAEIVARKNNHAKTMNQFDAMIANAGKEGASIEDASAAW